MQFSITPLVYDMYILLVLVIDVVDTVRNREMVLYDRGEKIGGCCDHTMAFLWVMCEDNFFYSFLLWKRLCIIHTYLWVTNCGMLSVHMLFIEI